MLNVLRAFSHRVAMCCDVLRHAGCCLRKFENGKLNLNQQQPTCRDTVAKRLQLVAPNNVAIL